jgi:hypothetical protein
MHGRQEIVSGIQQITEHEHRSTPDEDSAPPATQGPTTTISKELLSSSPSLVRMKNTYNWIHKKESPL